MKLKTIVSILLLLIIGVSVPGCLDNGAQAEIENELIVATWISPDISDNIVSVPVDVVESNINVHFKVDTQEGEIAVMAYKLGDNIIVRSNVCPPCGSIGFSLDNDILFCDACGTTFDANSGDGIQGACVAYPKENIGYTIIGENLVMDMDDIVLAHIETVKRG